LKNKIILSGLFLTTAISCSNFRPIVLNAFLDPESTTEVTYDDINWAYALFNQYSSGLTYDLRIDYSTLDGQITGNSIRLFDNGVQTFFNDWDTITSTFSLAENIDPFWKNAFNRILFDRIFDRTTKKAVQSNSYIQFLKWPNHDSVNITITMRSNIKYKVNIGSVFQAFKSVKGPMTESYFKYITFYNDNNKLQSFLLDTDNTFTDRNYLYDLSTILTNVNRFELQYQFLDIPPFETSGFGVVEIWEFNLFTQQQEISIPDDTSGDIFGFEFVAVEWWDFLGHLQNFAWWIVNKSPISPLFEWIDTYVITWISGLITFLTGVFNL
jgi:hypothetical protein